MVRNNIISFLILILVWIFIACFYPLDYLSFSHGILFDVLIFFTGLSIFFILGYLLCGVLIRDLKSPFKNLLSISSIAVISLCLYVFCEVYDGNNPLWWLIYYCFNFYARPLYLLVNSDVIIWGWVLDYQIMFSFIPVLLMWLGIELKIFIKNPKKQVALKSNK